MSNFDIRRFAKTARWQCGMSLKSVLSFAAGLSFGYLFPMFGWLYPYLKGEKMIDEGRLLHTVELCTLVYLVVIIIAGTWIFADMGTKAQRIKVKMLPATDLEKYLVRWLGVTLGTMVAGIAAYCVADVLRILTCLVAGVDYIGCTIPDFLRLLFTDTEIGFTTASTVPAKPKECTSLQQDGSFGRSLCTYSAARCCAVTSLSPSRWYTLCCSLPLRR